MHKPARPPSLFMTLRIISPPRHQSSGFSHNNNDQKSHPWLLMLVISYCFSEGFLHHLHHVNPVTILQIECVPHCVEKRVLQKWSPTLSDVIPQSTDLTIVEVRHWGWIGLLYSSPCLNIWHWIDFSWWRTTLFRFGRIPFTSPLQARLSDFLFGLCSVQCSVCSVQAGLILPDPLRRYFDLFPTELVCGTDEHNDPLVGARVKSGRGLSWGNDIGTMATMAINNDIFRWWMVAPPLLGGHHPTNQPLSQCHCRTTAAVVWHRDTPTVCNATIPILRIISKWSNHPPTRICPVSKCHNRAQF